MNRYEQLYGKGTLTIYQVGEEIFDLLAGSVPRIASWSWVSWVAQRLLGKSSDSYRYRWTVIYFCFSLHVCPLASHMAQYEIEIFHLPLFASSINWRLLIMLISYKSSGETQKRKGQRSRREVRGIFFSLSMKIFSLWENEEERLLPSWGKGHADEQRWIPAAKWEQRIISSVWTCH